MNEPQIRQFQTSDGYLLHFRHWPAATPRGFVVALHGIQSHSGWYGYSSGLLAGAGFDVRFLDRRGSGLNQQQRGHARHFRRLVNDVVQFLAEVGNERDQTAPQAPIVLLGLSWGGKLAAVTAAMHPSRLDGLALLYPGICTRFQPRWHQRRLLRLAGAFGKEHREVPVPLNDPALFTDQPEWQQFIDEDPLALRNATAGLLQASVDLDDAVRRITADIPCPLLLMLAGRDRIVDTPATRLWFDQIRCSEKQLTEYSHAAHTLEFDPHREKIFSDLVAWLCTVSRRLPHTTGLGRK